MICSLCSFRLSALRHRDHRLHRLRPTGAGEVALPERAKDGRVISTGHRVSRGRSRGCRLIVRVPVGAVGVSDDDASGGAERPCGSLVARRTDCGFGPVFGHPTHQFGGILMITYKSCAADGNDSCTGSIAVKTLITPIWTANLATNFMTAATGPINWPKQCRIFALVFRCVVGI